MPELILIKRTKPGKEPYWITPGGGVEPDVDRTVVDALHREVAEELGAGSPMWCPRSWTRWVIPRRRRVE